MRTNKVIGIILIAVGIASFAFQVITYTTREKAIDLGPMQVTKAKTHSIPLPPIVGALALACGIVLLIVDKKRA